MTQPPTADANEPRRAKQVYVVLPAYNEEARIGKLLDHIDEAMHMRLQYCIPLSS